MKVVGKGESRKTGLTIEYPVVGDTSVLGFAVHATTCGQAEKRGQRRRSGKTEHARRTWLDSIFVDFHLFKEYTIVSCRSGGIGRRAGFRDQWAFRPWGFESPLRHHFYVLPTSCTRSIQSICATDNVSGTLNQISPFFALRRPLSVADTTLFKLIE